MPRNAYPVETTIVILSLLRQDYTASCISSIFKHTHGSFEVIVVDMGGSKRIKSWLTRLSLKYENFTVLFNNKNVGTAKGRNQAIRVARGRFVVFLDNDARVLKNWLQPFIEVAAEDETIGACGAKVISKQGGVIYCASRIKALTKKRTVTHIGLEFSAKFRIDNPEVNFTREVFWYPTTCFFVKRDVLDIIGGFDEKLFMCEEDKDLAIAIRKAGFRILYVPSSCVYHDHGCLSTPYKNIRLNPRILMNDIKYFQRKHNCKVFINYSRSYLKTSGWKDIDIDRIKRFDFFYKIAN